MHSDHNSHDSDNTHIISENSLQDKFLSLLAALVLVGLLITGYYWQTLPLPAAETEESTK